MRHLGGARNGNDPGLLRQQPSQGELSRCRILPLCPRPRHVDQAPCSPAAHRAQTAGWRNGSPSRQSACRQLPCRRGNPCPSDSSRRSRCPAPRRVEGLAPPARDTASSTRSESQRAVGRHARGESSADRVRTSPNLQDLALGDQVLDRAGHVLDGHLRIDPMLVEQVDVVGSQAPQLGRRPFA